MIIKIGFYFGFSRFFAKPREPDFFVAHTSAQFRPCYVISKPSKAEFRRGSCGAVENAIAHQISAVFLDISVFSPN